MDESGLQELVIPLTVLLAHILLVVIAAIRRALRGRDTVLLVAYLLVGTGWILAAAEFGLGTILPGVDWNDIAPYLLLGMGALLWAYTRAFLHKPIDWPPWLLAVVAVTALAASQVGLVTLPPMSLTVGAITITEGEVPTLISAGVSGVYVILAAVNVLLEYVRRASPLHRNRMAYWVFGALPLVAGSALIAASEQSILQLAGAAVHWLGATLFTYILTQPHLANIGTGVRRALRQLLTSLLTVGVTTSVSLGIVYLLSESGMIPLELGTELVIGLAAAGAVVLLFYEPVSNLAGRVMNRLLFGRGYRAQLVMREYSQAVTQILSLDTLTAAAMQIINDALGIDRGTLLVVEDAREEGWWLRPLEGLNVSSEQPQLLLPANTHLAEWLVERSAPLHQYTLDVDPRFATLSDGDRESWRQLEMEVFVPISRSDSLLGILALGLRLSGQPYGDAELDLLAMIANQTAVALENASLFARVERRAEQLALLNEIGRVITTSLELDQAVDLITQRIADAFSGSSGFVFLVDESGDLMLLNEFGADVMSANPEEQPFVVHRDQGLIGWVATAGKSLSLSDPAQDARYATDVEGKLIPNAGSALCVPIMAKGEPIGVILVASPSRAGLGTAELDLLDSIGSFASIAIENARQVVAREARLRNQVEKLQIEIDQLKRAKQVEEITDTAQFRRLQTQARELRKERAAAQKGLFDRLQEEVDKREGVEERSTEIADEISEVEEAESTGVDEDSAGVNEEQGNEEDD